MLVLSRKSGQKLIIDNDIEVLVLETKGDTVKLGIKAPKSISVYREEIYEEIKKSNQQATQPTPASALDQVSDLIIGKYPFKQDPKP